MSKVIEAIMSANDADNIRNEAARTETSRPAAETRPARAVAVPPASAPPVSAPPVSEPPAAAPEPEIAPSAEGESDNSDDGPTPVSDH